MPHILWRRAFFVYRTTRAVAKIAHSLVGATSGNVAVHPVDMVSSLRFHSDPSASYCGHYDFFWVHPESSNKSKVASLTSGSPSTRVSLGE